MAAVTLKEGFIIRAPRMSDVEAVTDVMNACTIKVIGEADESVEDTRRMWESPEIDLERDLRVVETPDGHLAAYAVVEPILPVTSFIDVYVHPDYETTGIGDRLMAWVEDRARQRFDVAPEGARITVRGGCYAQDDWYRGLLESAGLRSIRHSWRMQINLDEPPPAPEWPDGLTLRVVQRGDDLRPILHCQRDSFRDHFGFVETPFEQNFQRWTHRWDVEGDWDPSLWFLAMDGDTVAGISLCKVGHHGDDQTGWVGTLGVRREYRRMGLGLALLRHSFVEFYRRGFPRVGLGVDASSLTGATRLYLGAGMFVAQQFDLYEKELRPGTVLETQSVE